MRIAQEAILKSLRCETASLEGFVCRAWPIWKSWKERKIHISFSFREDELIAITMFLHTPASVGGFLLAFVDVWGYCAIVSSFIRCNKLSFIIWLWHHSYIACCGLAPLRRAGPPWSVIRSSLWSIDASNWKRLFEYHRKYLHLVAFSDKLFSINIF